MTGMTDSKAADVLAVMFQLHANNRQMTEADALAAAIARLREPAGVGGEWVLVPRKPTFAMRNTFTAGMGSATHFTHTTLQCADFDSRYSHMLALAPQPPAEAQAQGGGEVVVTDLAQMLRDRAAAHGGDKLLEEAAAALEAAREDACVALVADIRFACGDNGKRMQPELVEFIRGLAADAEKWRESGAGK